MIGVWVVVFQSCLFEYFLFRVPYPQGFLGQDNLIWSYFICTNVLFYFSLDLCRKQLMSVYEKAAWTEMSRFIVDTFIFFLFMNSLCIFFFL